MDAATPLDFNLLDPGDNKLLNKSFHQLGLERCPLVVL